MQYCCNIWPTHSLGLDCKWRYQCERSQQWLCLQKTRGRISGCFKAEVFQLSPVSSHTALLCGPSCLSPSQTQLFFHSPKSYLSWPPVLHSHQCAKSPQAGAGCRSRSYLLTLCSTIHRENVNAFIPQGFLSEFIWSLKVIKGSYSAEFMIFHCKQLHIQHLLILFKNEFLKNKNRRNHN